jgi:hypothetical protein
VAQGRPIANRQTVCSTMEVVAMLSDGRLETIPLMFPVLIMEIFPMALPFLNALFQKPLH